MLHRNAVRVRAETARSLPNATHEQRWRAVRQVVAFFAFTVGYATLCFNNNNSLGVISGAVLLVVFMQPVSAKEDEIRETKRPPARFQAVSESSDDED